MLRSGVVIFGLAALLVGAIAIISGALGPSLVFMLWGIVLVGGIAFERFRYKPLTRKRPGPGWERTTERFVDDDTGKTVTVYIQPETGERAYVED